ncbi:serine/threonine kinase [Richelia intracellularis HH01]|jgi:serine/threonine-protein kinase|uniref:non-specific serine/threonine protein kinase n=2 Tax=Richelia TaxID=98443 RepID=M1X4X6_9NOST|nr:serine/threonine kinase [Richelia intracellularis HH01]
MKILKTSIHKTIMQENESDNYVGTVLNNRYLIRDLIGKGGMGKVYIAEDVAKGGMPVAVKVLYMSIFNQQISQRFAREIFIGSQLGRKSQHIVRLLSYGITEEYIPFYVMEYLQGKNLKQMLKNKPLTIKQFLDICIQICLGLECAHKGVKLKGKIIPIIHRDIKPENIFFSEDGKFGSTVKILDFGIAKFMTERTGIKLSESFIGSLPYCSPEYMEGRKVLDGRSDIYSLGIIMFEMLTGKHPFSPGVQSFENWYQVHHFQIPPDIKEINPDVKVPEELKNLIKHCLSKEVDFRPQNVTSILNTLNEIKQTINIPTESILAKQQESVKLISAVSLTAKECWHQTWPDSKPKGVIAFPCLLNTQQGLFPTFWAMLPRKEITTFLNTTSTLTEFISKMNIYPMILWGIILYKEDSTFHRCLSYYLDLNTNSNKIDRIIHKLSEIGYYHLLLFSLEEPQECSHVITIHLNINQRKELLFYLENRHTYNVLMSKEQVKTKLKSQYEQLRVRLINNIINRNKSKKNKLQNIISLIKSKI